MSVERSVACDFTKELGNGNSATRKEVIKQLLNTMAHEIGHILIGAGHPDQHNSSTGDGGGPAPLAMDPALQAHRLMVSGEAPFRKNDYELVNVEWWAAHQEATDILSKSPENE